ncbi:minor capsid protein [Peribacillus sp. NPDC097198]|uniref:minor capsid protein n=1 Tax=Peribacillus sp. NPDC097198 TaxID=3364397 RepID=UPI003810713F
MNEFEEYLILIVEEMFDQAIAEHTEVLKLYKKSQDNILEYLNSLFLKYGNDGLITYSDLYKDNRLQSIESFLQKELDNLHQNENTLVYALLSALYAGTYYKNAYAFERALGNKSRYNKLTAAFIATAIERNWSGVLFTQRIKNNHNSLLQKILSDFSQSIRLGESMDKIKGKIDKQFGIRYNHSKSLSMTESARVITESQEKLFSDSGVVKKLGFTAVLDHRTTDFCRNHDGLVWSIDDPTRPELPAHLWCRSVWMPILKDYLTINSNASFDMYDEWFEQI